MLFRILFSLTPKLRYLIEDPPCVLAIPLGVKPTKKNPLNLVVINFWLAVYNELLTPWVVPNCPPLLLLLPPNYVPIWPLPLFSLLEKGKCKAEWSVVCTLWFGGAWGVTGSGLVSSASGSISSIWGGVPPLETADAHLQLCNLIHY